MTPEIVASICAEMTSHRSTFGAERLAREKCADTASINRCLRRCEKR